MSNPIVIPALTPQVEVTMTQDLTDWLWRPSRRDGGQRFHFRAGRTYRVDEAHAVDWIVKGYATGGLPRKVSDDEKAELRAQVSRVSLRSGGR